MEIQIVDLMTMIAQDKQDIYDRLAILKRHLILSTTNSTLPLLYDLQDVLILYQYIKQTAIYDQLYPEHDLKIIRFTETHLQSIGILKRCIHSIKRQNKSRYLAQLYILITLLAIYLEEEYHYLNQILSEQLLVQQTQQMAQHYEQLKFDYKMGFENGIITSNDFELCECGPGVITLARLFQLLDFFFYQIG